MTAKPERHLFTGVQPFVAVAREKSFQLAARRLGVTPSAVSKAIGRLEADLGVRLLERTARSVLLTAEGESFLEDCQLALSHLERARERIDSARESVRGNLVVSLPILLGQQVMPQLARLTERYPELSLRVMLTDRFVDLAAEGVDAVIRIGTFPESRLIARRLRTVRWVTVASPSYLLRRGAPRSPADLEAHNCLAFLLTSGLPQLWQYRDAHGQAITIVPRGKLKADHGGSLLDAARDGVGIFQAHDYAVEAAIRRGELVEVLREYAGDGPAITLLHGSGRKASPKLRAFRELAIELLGDAASGASPRVERPLVASVRRR